MMLITSSSVSFISDRFSGLAGCFRLHSSHCHNLVSDAAIWYTHSFTDHCSPVVLKFTCLADKSLMLFSTSVRVFFIRPTAFFLSFPEMEPEVVPANPVITSRPNRI